MARSSVSNRISPSGRVSASNRVSTDAILYQNDFTSGFTGMTNNAGTWAATGGVLTSTAGAGGNWNQRLITTDATTFGDFNVTARIRKPSFNVMIAFRTGTTTGSGYGLQIRGLGGSSALRLERWGSATIVNNAGGNWVEGNWYRVRVRCQGALIQCRIWNDADSEPGTWNIETNNTQFASGRIGFAGESATGTAEFDDLIVNALSVRSQIT